MSTYFYSEDHFNIVQYLGNEHYIIFIYGDNKIPNKLGAKLS